VKIRFPEIHLEPFYLNRIVDPITGNGGQFSCTKLHGLWGDKEAVKETDRRQKTDTEKKNTKSSKS